MGASGALRLSHAVVDARHKWVDTSPPFLTAVAPAPLPLCLMLDWGTRVACAPRTHCGAVTLAAAKRCRAVPGMRRILMLLWAVVGVVLIGVVLLDAFETIVLPRRATRRLRLARLVLRSLWQLWSCPARGPWRSGERRETYLSFYGPFALFLLIGVWVTGLIGGFALLLWGLRAQLVAAGGDASVGRALHGSGPTVCTL